MIQETIYRGFRILVEDESSSVYCYRIYPFESGTFLDQDNSKFVRQARLSFGLEANAFRRTTDEAMDWVDWHHDRVRLFIKQSVEAIEDERRRYDTN